MTNPAINKNLLANLNEAQYKAVTAVDGPVVVYAGAGTGKTKTLTSRIAYLIQECNINPEEILAITFTKKAANEMKTRVIDMVGPEAFHTTISTIHSFCARILRKEIPVLGYSRDFEIIDDDEASKIITKCYAELKIDKKYLPHKACLAQIGAFKNLVLPCLFNPLEKIYNAYQAILKKGNLLDFDDLLVLAHKLFVEYPSILERYQNKYKYCLVDEFQDTNLIQYKIIKMLSPKNLFVVGDDDQSIYSFRGACVQNILDFQRDFPEATIVKLTQNYRSTDNILRGANAMIAMNQNREKKELFSEIKGDHSDVQVNDSYYYEDEGRFVVDEIMRLVSKGARYSDIAILYRNNVISRNFELAFLEHKIPYQIYGGFTYLKRREVKDVIAYLKFIVEPTNILHFNRIINLPSRGIGEKTLERLAEIVDNEDKSIYEAIDLLHERLVSTKSACLVEFKKLIISFQERIDSMSLEAFFDMVMEETGYLKELAAEDDEESNRVNNVKEFKSILFSIEQRDDNLTSSQKLRLSFDELILDEGAVYQNRDNCVTLSTIHSAKGLEFPVVFLVAFEEGIFPTLHEDVDIEEERRIAYVAVTRAKRRLYLSTANRRLIYGTIRKNQKSRFVLEYLSGQQIEAKPSEGQISRVLEVGCNIRHDTFGDGLVVALDDSTIQVVFTRDKSIRRLMKNHPSITIL